MSLMNLPDELIAMVATNLDSDDLSCFRLANKKAAKTAFCELRDRVSTIIRYGDHGHTSPKQFVTGLITGLQERLPTAAAKVTTLVIETRYAPSLRLPNLTQQLRLPALATLQLTGIEIPACALRALFSAHRSSLRRVILEDVTATEEQCPATERRRMEVWLNIIRSVQKCEKLVYLDIHHFGLPGVEGHIRTEKAKYHKRMTRTGAYWQLNNGGVKAKGDGREGREVVEKGLAAFSKELRTVLGYGLHE